ncbi:hypothetical protein HETIRDRAFT_418760 [Heterobasidion irregulare TC 32-1]|uniref:Secreted protein n=1 Tax=Heterobasidion irregulare (strain TC 32-1) TaxID=747525 RepID=W4K6Z5_HETIT|nr:uncharacterized protein HETIRDRAFT_418760 [Heterobasidion irregulare TC 32-1]ETW80806.1 hypothetical protein HETIRDRAFT_418760 [Heterobasidion irregulare TC 32-1]
MPALNNQTCRFHSPLIAACLCTQLILGLAVCKHGDTIPVSAFQSRCRWDTVTVYNDVVRPCSASAAPVKLMDGYGRCIRGLIETIKSPWLKTRRCRGCFVIDADKWPVQRQ